MKKSLLIYNLIFVAIIIAFGIIKASSTSQAILSLLFLPVAFYFLRQLVLSFRSNTTLSIHSSSLAASPSRPRLSSTQATTGQVIDPEVLSDKDISDINRRLFLKLIGSAGLATFTLSLFTKRSHAAFFGSIPGPGTVGIKDVSGNLINPAEKQPTDGYEIADVDDDTLPAYYGFIDKDGNWYIAREGTDGDFRYHAGTTDYTTNWTGRDLLTYNLFNDVF